MKQGDFKKVEITWIDSWEPHSKWEWIDEVKAKKPCIVSTVGWLLEDKPMYKLVAQSIAKDGQICTGVLTIYKQFIKKVEIISNS